MGGSGSHGGVTPQRSVPLERHHHVPRLAHKRPVPRRPNKERCRVHVRAHNVKAPERNQIDRSGFPKNSGLPKLVTGHLAYPGLRAGTAPEPRSAVFLDGATAVSPDEEVHPVGVRTDARWRATAVIACSCGRKGELAVLVASPAPKGAVVFKRQNMCGTGSDALPIVGRHRAAAAHNDPGLFPQIGRGAASRGHRAEAHQPSGSDLRMLRRSLE